jgi:DNA-binding transcriptional regulator YiaG
MIGIGLKMGSMDTKYNTDSVGARIAWMRKQRKMTGHDLARALGVRNVYVSQIDTYRYT